jgi:hypothetical protein
MEMDFKQKNGGDHLIPLLATGPHGGPTNFQPFHFKLVSRLARHRHAAVDHDDVDHVVLAIKPLVTLPLSMVANLIYVDKIQSFPNKAVSCGVMK